MSVRYAWLTVLVLAALLVAACGPEMTTPTAPATKEAASGAPTGTQGDAPTSESASAADVPVDEDDWRTLGSADAPVTVIEYSDFQ